MDTINPQQTQRVWQRVLGPTAEAPCPELEGLIALEWEASSAYPILNRRTGGRFSPVFQQLTRQSRSRWSCLQGMELLRTGKRPPHIHPHSPGGSGREILQLCCSRALEAMELYRKICTARDSPILARLAQEQTADCRTLLELLGNWAD